MRFETFPSLILNIVSQEGKIIFFSNKSKIGLFVFLLLSSKSSLYP